jgi:hypothetical protein
VPDRYDRFLLRLLSREQLSAAKQKQKGRGLPGAPEFLYHLACFLQRIPSIDAKRSFSTAIAHFEAQTNCGHPIHSRRIFELQNSP